MSKTIIDARGLSCPEPVLLTKKALREHSSGGFSVLVSSPTAKENVVSLLSDNGFSPTVEAQADGWAIQV